MVPYTWKLFLGLCSNIDNLESHKTGMDPTICVIREASHYREEIFVASVN